MSGTEESQGKDEGWIEWRGGKCPVSPDATIEVRTLYDTCIALAKTIAWDYPFGGYKVRAYRIHKES